MRKRRLLSLLVLLAAVVTGAVAQTTYKVSVKEGTEDAANWTAKAKLAKLNPAEELMPAAPKKATPKKTAPKKAESKKAEPKDKKK